MAIIGMVSIVGYCGDKMANHESVNHEISYFNVSGFFGHIGVAMFLFEGNAVILNVRSETKDQEKYPKILIMALISAICVFTGFALICYFTYLDETLPIFTLNLVPINGFVIFIMVCVCFNALCSYPV